jgi:hypothetical protein
MTFRRKVIGSSQRKSPGAILRGFFFVTDQPPQVRVRIRIMKLS